MYKFLIITFLLIGKLSIAQDCAIVELAKDFSRNSELKTLLQEDNSFKTWRILFSENPSLRSSVPEIKLVTENIEQIEKLGGYKNWIATLSREEREVPKLLFDTQKKFEETVNTSQLPKHLRALVYQYYKKANSENKPHLWKRIEEIFSEYNINRKFPPCNGEYNIRDKVNISEFTKYDRYCNPIGNWDGTSAPILGGSFTSPIVNGKPFDFSSRALNLSENEYKIYFEIEVLEDTGLIGQLADVIPWFNQKGQGKQMMWNLPKDPTTNYPKTWNQLAEEGKIRITIKDVHSNDPNLLKWKGKIETFMTLFDPKDIEQFSHLVRDLQKGGTWTEGAEWTLRYLNQNTISFKGRKLVFEQIEKWGDIENKIIHITDVTDKTDIGHIIYIEFKSVKEVPPNGFVKQFINDLSRDDVRSLDQIRWIFDRSKNPLGKNGEIFRISIEKSIESLNISKKIAEKFGTKNPEELKDLIINNFDKIFVLK